MLCERRSPIIFWNFQSTTIKTSTTDWYDCDVMIDSMNSTQSIKHSVLLFTSLLLLLLYLLYSKERTHEKKWRNQSRIPSPSYSTYVDFSTEIYLPYILNHRPQLSPRTKFASQTRSSHRQRTTPISLLSFVTSPLLSLLLTLNFFSFNLSNLK